MIIIHHRRNSEILLKETPIYHGVEVDIRSYQNNLIISHDPYVPSITFSKWLSHYKHKLLVVNIKEEGLEQKIINLLKKYNVENFFFLDQSFPFLIKTAFSGERRSAIRVSEFEAKKTALNLQGKLNWIWIDYFTKFPLKEKELLDLKNKGFKLCVVSPELQGHSESETIELRNQLQKFNTIDAVCTKLPHIWQN